MNTKTAESKLKICILSDSPFICTGYSNQAKLLAKYLKSKGHEIHFLANSYQGQTVDYSKLEDGTEFDYKNYGQKSQYFQAEMSDMLKKIKPDIFLILLDTFMLYPWFLNVDTSPAKTMFWFPSDGGGGMPAGCENILKKVDVPIAMAEFGQNQVSDYHQVKTEHIPHGTEPDRYYKLPEKEMIELRAKNNLTDKFVVGCVARNQPRKMLDRMLKSFRLVANQIPSAVLFLHMDPTDPAAPWDIRSMIMKYNLENRVIFSGMSAMNAFDWGKMNEVYNLMDIFFLSTSGEGFGIPIIEAMSCEVPVVATSYTSTHELVEKNNSGIGVKLSGVEYFDMSEFNSKEFDKLVANGTLTGSWAVERGLMDINDAAKQIVKLFNNPKLREELGNNGRSAVLSKYDFNKFVGPAFEKLMLK